MTAVLQLRGVTKSYGDQQVLGGIDLELLEHQAVALIGGSGSGKSTMLRCIDLLEEIDDGDIYLDGDPITVPGMDPVPIRRRLGLVFQAFNLFPHRNVIDNVIMGAVRAQGVPASPRRSEIRPGDARAVRPRGPLARVPRPPLRRAAAAGRDRPGADDAARERCCSTRSPRRSIPSSSARS